MNKELPLDERIQKLFESSWVNEFNHLENQLLEARYLLTCLNKKYTQLTNNWNELEECVESRLMSIPDDICTNEVEEARRTTKIAVYQVILGKMKEIKERKNERTIN